MPVQATQSKGPSVDQRHEVQAQELARLREQLRDQTRTVRQEIWNETRHRHRIAIALLTVAALVVGGLIGRFGFPRPLREAVSPTSEPVSLAGTAQDRNGTDKAVIATPWPLRVYVSGAVAEAQVVELPAGSLVADAIEAAGGAASDADLEALNLAAPVGDNQQITVPRLAERPVQTAGVHDALVGTPLIDINRASCEELASLPYIGETKAAAIVDYRARHGAFAHIEEIQNVSGIGPTTFAHIADLITVGP